MEKSNPKVPELLLSVICCSICAPTFSVKPELLATEGKKKARTHKVAKVSAFSLPLEKKIKKE